MKRLVQNLVRSYHWLCRRRPLPDRLAVYFHTLEKEEREPFVEAIRWIKAQGYSFAGPGEFLTAPGKVCYVSFDDNFRAWYEALPLFEELGVRAAFFINTCVLRGECSPADMARYCRIIGYRNDFTPLSRTEIRELREAGHWIGGHTHSHVALSRVSPAEAEREIQTNLSILADITGGPVTDFAFPFGLPRFFTPQVRDVAVRLGCKTISWATPGMLHDQRDPLTIHRTQWKYNLSGEDNVKNLAVDGRWFVKLTGRSPVG